MQILPCGKNKICPVQKLYSKYLKNLLKTLPNLISVLANLIYLMIRLKNLPLFEIEGQILRSSKRF